MIPQVPKVGRDSLGVLGILSDLDRLTHGGAERLSEGLILM